MIGESIYMLPSDINLRIGKVKDYSNKILISLISFNPITANVRQSWTNYVNNENKYLIIGEVISSEYSNT